MCTVESRCNSAGAERHNVVEASILKGRCVGGNNVLLCCFRCRPKSVELDSMRCPAKCLFCLELL